MGFWDAANSAPSSPSALPSGGAGASSFWNEPSASTAQTTVGQSEVPDSPGNPLSYIGGTLMHIVTGVPELLKGLWTIGKSTAEDALAGFEQIMPGPKYSPELRVEQQGYNWGNIVRAAPHMLQQDYASRYGFHGLDEVKDQVYSNPLGYILDALMVSGAAATGAKVAGKAGLISEEAVAAVRGITPTAEAAMAGQKPVTNVMGLLGKLPDTPVQSFASDITAGPLEGAMGITTSFSSLKRMIQNTIINKTLSRSSEAASGLIENSQWSRLGIPEDNIALQAQAIERVAASAQAGLNIIKPQAEKFVASRAARYISGLSKTAFYGDRNAMIQKLHGILGTTEGKDWQLVQDIMGTNDYFEAQLRGEVIAPRGLPSSAAIDVEAGLGDIVKYGPTDVPMVTATDPAARVSTMEAIQGFFNNTPDTPGQYFTTPHSIGRQAGENSTTMRYTGLVGDIKDAPNAARQYAQASGDTLLGVRNTLADQESAWNGLDYFFQKPTGQVYSINIADQNLFDAQKLVSAINDHVQKWTGVEISLETEGAQVLKELGGDIEMGLGAEDAAKMARLDQIGKLTSNLKEELEAATMRAQRIWDHPMRNFNGGYEGFGENAEKVDQIFNWSEEYLQQNMVKLWNPNWATGILKPDGSLEMLKGPYTVAMNRAFMPQKLEALHSIMEWGQDKIAQIIKDAMAEGVYSTDEIVDNIGEFLSEVGHMPRDSVKNALMIPTDKDVARAIFGSAEQGQVVTSPMAVTRMREIADEAFTGAAGEAPTRARNLPIQDPDQAAKLVIKRLSQEVRTPILKGEIDGQLLEDWGWKTFAESSPQIPGYYPHIRAGSNSGLWWKGSTMKTPQMAFSKGFKGYLMESGRVEADVFKSYAFRGYQILRHQELIDQFERLRPMAREMSQKELMLVQSGARGLDGEVLFSPDFAKSQLELHSTLLDNIHDGVKDGALYEDAARDAIQGINDELQAMTTDALAGAKVYALPQHVADQFKTGFLQGFSPARMRMFWDKPRDLWISSVLGLNPRWFIYRTMGNIVFTGIQHPLDIPRLFGWARAKNNDLIQMLMEDAKMPDGSSVLDSMSRGYASGEMQKLGFINAEAKVGKLGTPAIAQRLRLWGSAADEFPRMTRALDAVYESRLAKIPRGVSAFTTRKVNILEQAERRGVGLGAMARETASGLDSNITLARRIATEGFDPQMINRMMGEANWTLGNYTNLSPLERDVVRRFLMPFYPFYRHMLKFATRMPWDHPLKSAVLQHLHDIDEDMGPHLPDYLGGGVYIGNIGGLPSYWNITHWNPVSELSVPEASPMTFIDPRIKMAIQAMTGTDEFMRPYHADNVYTAPNGTEMIRTSSGWQRFEGIQHEPWLEMFMSLYGGPGAQALNPHGYNVPAWKAAAGQAGFSLSQYDVLGNALRDLEATQAAYSSSSARQVPTSFGS